MMRRVRKKHFVRMLMLPVCLFMMMFTVGCGDDDTKTGETVAVIEETTVAESQSTRPETNTEPSESSTTAGKSQTQPTEAIIGEGEVLEIALKDAGKAETEVGYPLIKKRFEKGIYIYNVKFNQENTKWEYDINAENGTIIKKSVDMGDDQTETQPSS